MEAPARSLLDVFTDQATAVGADVRVTTVDDLAGDISRITEVEPVWSVGITQEATALFPALAGLRRETSEWPEIAIGRGMFGIAQTGTVVIAEANHRDHLMTLLCIRHVVLLPAASIAPARSDAVPVLRSWLQSGVGRYVTFVTGPSRTSDIERVLTRGAHGPRDVTVVLIEGWEPDSA